MTPEQIQSKTLKLIIRPIGFAAGWIVRVYKFACLHLKKGTSPKYIKDQLGHARYETTINVYGKSLHYSDHGLADKLDNGFGQKRLDWGEK